MKKEQYVYHTELSEIAAPVFDHENKLIYSCIRGSASDRYTYTYIYIDGVLTLIDKDYYEATAG